MLFRALARPPLRPAVRTVIVPRPVLLRELEAFLRDDVLLRAVVDFERVDVLFRVPRAFEREAVLFRVPVDFERELEAFLRVPVDFERELDDFLRDEPLDFDFEREELDLREDEDFVSPDFARCLLTVRAAISLARSVDSPFSCSDSLTCSY